MGDDIKDIKVEKFNPKDLFGKGSGGRRRRGGRGRSSEKEKEKSSGRGMAAEKERSIGKGKASEKEKSGGKGKQTKGFGDRFAEKRANKKDSSSPTRCGPRAPYSGIFPIWQKMLPYPKGLDSILRIG